MAIGAVHLSLDVALCIELDVVSLQPREPTGGAGGNQAIMVITTGVAQGYAHVFTKYNSHDQKVKLSYLTSKSQVETQRERKQFFHFLIDLEKICTNEVKRNIIYFLGNCVQ